MNSIHDPRYRRLIQRLRQARCECGLTQEQVAGVLGWGRTVVSNIEICERRADMLEVYQLAELYGLRLSDLEPILRIKSGQCA